MQQVDHYDSIVFMISYLRLCNTFLDQRALMDLQALFMIRLLAVILLCEIVVLGRTFLLLCVHLLKVMQEKLFLMQWFNSQNSVFIPKIYKTIKTWNGKIKESV